MLCNSFLMAGASAAASGVSPLKTRASPSLSSSSSSSSLPPSSLSPLLPLLLPLPLLVPAAVPVAAAAPAAAALEPFLFRSRPPALRVPPPAPPGSAPIASASRKAEPPVRDDSARGIRGGSALPSEMAPLPQNSYCFYRRMGVKINSNPIWSFTPLLELRWISHQNLFDFIREHPGNQIRTRAGKGGPYASLSLSLAPFVSYTVPSTTNMETTAALTHAGKARHPRGQCILNFRSSPALPLSALPSLPHYSKALLTLPSSRRRHRAGGVQGELGDPNRFE